MTHPEEEGQYIMTFFKVCVGGLIDYLGFLVLL